TQSLPPAGFVCARPLRSVPTPTSRARHLDEHTAVVADDEPVSATWGLSRTYDRTATDERVTHVPHVTQRGPLQDDGVVDAGLADQAVVADSGVRADVTVT